MLPFQITLEGFMSYRDKTTISFEGAALWMLAGANGAGKSSVFDAMRWTLFGAHRGGKSGHEALIHHGLDRLRVAFDLELDARRFRLIRTLARAGRSTWQIEEITGEVTTKIPETDMREGYEKWVRDHVGIGDETFGTAMYLAQNRGDAILSVNAQQRYDMLAEIVDISAYAALHDRAKTRALELEAAARAAEKAWQLAPGADGDEIAALSEQIETLSAQNARAGARREVLLGLDPLAAQWERWEKERAETRSALENARLLLRDAPGIERDFARLQFLETLLLPLQNYVETRGRAAQKQRDSDLVVAMLKSAREGETHRKTRLENLQGERDGLESASGEAQNRRLSLISESAELAPRLSTARQIASYLAEIVALEAELGAFPADLKHQKAALEARIAQAQDELAALAIVRRLARDQAVFQAARAREIEAQTAAQTLQNALPQARETARHGAAQCEATRRGATRAIEQLAATRARRADTQSSLERFESVQNEPNCSFCGQKLTPEHAQKERFYLENALNSAQKEQQSAEISLKGAESKAQEAQKAAAKSQTALRDAETRLENNRREEQEARTAASQALANAASTWGELSSAWQGRIASQLRNGGEPKDGAFLGGGESNGQALELASLSSAPFPVVAARGNNGSQTHGFSPVEAEPAPVVALLQGDSLLERLKSPADQSQGMEKWRLELENLSEQGAEQTRVTLRWSDRKDQLALLLEAARGADLHALFRRESELQSALETAQQTLKTLEASLLQARQAFQGAQKELDEARELSARLLSRQAALAAAQTEIERALQSLKSALLAPFWKRDEAALRAQLQDLGGEQAALKGRDLGAQIVAVRAAQSRVASLEADVARLEKALESVPQGARRPRGELQSEAAALKDALEEGEAAQKRLQGEKSRLEERRGEKIRLENAHLEAQNAARQHKTLADLLGPHELQRFLLREAENGIIDEANAVLDRISSGTLRLELRADDEEITGARKGTPKVLDITIFRADSTGQGLLPSFLSGSQRFRVAVALALGIGRYATRGGGTKLEAVIIDEGFGALDKIGRGEMIEELQLLGQELRRVILVSHQEEFFEAFPNRYLIENNGETSTARLMVS